MVDASGIGPPSKANWEQALTKIYFEAIEVTSWFGAFIIIAKPIIIYTF